MFKLSFKRVKVNVINAEGQRIGTVLCGDNRDHVMGTLVTLHDPFQSGATSIGMSRFDKFDSMVMAQGTEDQVPIHDFIIEPFSS